MLIQTFVYAQLSKISLFGETVDKLTLLGCFYVLYLLLKSYSRVMECFYFSDLVKMSVACALMTFLLHVGRCRCIFTLSGVIGTGR